MGNSLLQVKYFTPRNSLFDLKSAKCHQIQLIYCKTQRKRSHLKHFFANNCKYFLDMCRFLPHIFGGHVFFGTMKLLTMLASVWPCTQEMYTHISMWQQNDWIVSYYIKYRYGFKSHLNKYNGPKGYEGPASSHGSLYQNEIIILTFEITAKSRWGENTKYWMVIFVKSREGNFNRVKFVLKDLRGTTVYYFVHGLDILTQRPWRVKVIWTNVINQGIKFRNRPNIAL